MFAEKYPDSGVVEAYGGQWADVRCIDWWVYVEAERRQCRVSVEGWNLPDLRLDLTGAGDGFALADLFARLLAVPSPSVGAG
ncbi:hypothetical protein [Nocardioides dongkuii]|uniref:hypothetical protein n=1 Tax=Nocardioides dongkuii TaxID=2760089 RepID=UPI0015FCDB5D|nr:hypothetical protein [Nocardioides dongkuii]